MVQHGDAAGDRFGMITTGDLAPRAASVLRANDLGGWTKAAPNLYPHQWSWDSAFIAIGWARLDVRRAVNELQSLFAAQWATGMIPHIVFNPKSPPGSYFPDADRWDCHRLTAAAPPDPIRTSGLCEPPVHAIAVWHIWNVASRRGAAERAENLTFLRAAYPHLLAWHRFLLTERDPEGTGLVTILHPWESGMDNSPRWDTALAAVDVGELPPYQRADLKHVTDASERPSTEDYDRYLWLVEVLKRDGYDQAIATTSHPFRLKDVFFSAILVAANEALMAIADLLDAPESDREEIAGWIERGRAALDRQWDQEQGLCLDLDLRTAEPVPVQTVAGFAPLIAGTPSPERRQGLLRTLDSPAFAGHPDFRWPLPPSTSPESTAFDPRRYWRGPNWPVITWLFWWALVRAGEQDRARHLRQAGLNQIETVGFAEYVEPFTGDPLGSLDQSWTAAVALDWLAPELGR
jgi:hypothetical protein